MSKLESKMEEKFLLSEPKPDPLSGLTQEELQAEHEKTRKEISSLGKFLTEEREKLKPFEEEHWKLVEKKWALERKLTQTTLLPPKGSKSSPRKQKEHSILDGVTPQDLAEWRAFRQKTRNVQSLNDSETQND